MTGAGDARPRRRRGGDAARPRGQRADARRARRHRRGRVARRGARRARAGGRQLRRLHGRRRRGGRLGQRRGRQLHGRRQRRRGGGARRAPRSSTSRRTTSSTAPSASRGSSPIRPARSGVYGETKLGGEHAVAEATSRHAIVRTAWLFGAGGKNFVDTMLGLGAQRDEVAVVTDQVGCPTWTGHLAGALVELAERPDETGIHHIAGAGSCSWNELALELFDRAGVECRVRPATTRSVPAAGAPARVQRARHRASAAARLAAVAPGRRRLPRHAGDAHEAPRLRRRRLHRLELRAPAPARPRRRDRRARQAHLRRAAREPRRPRHRVRARGDRGRGRRRRRRSTASTRS